MLRSPRRSAALALATFVAAASVLAATAGPALADSEKVVTVVATNSLVDSGLVQSVIEPRFEAANPGLTLDMKSRNSGGAVSDAENGRASAMLVDAPSLENHFVGQGYSLEPYGRAILWSDYVLVGPADDPAGVLSGGQPSHDIVGAFEKIAAAGAQGTANLVSEGSYAATTIQEHQLWALTHGVKTCTYDDIYGGGTVPSTKTGDCPARPVNPSWYHSTYGEQRSTVQDADTCHYAGGGCYMFTDRGTYEYLKAHGSISTNLQILVRGNDPAARGTDKALLSSFHAYGVSAAKFASNTNIKINTTGALTFLKWISSPAAQSAIGAYLANNTDNDGAPFIADAAPAVTATALPTTVASGTTFSVTATVHNIAPDTPPLVGKTISLLFTASTAGAQPQTVAAAKTDAAGHVVFRVRPTETGKYSLGTRPMTQIEDSSLTPPYGDFLVATTTSPIGKVVVT